MQSNLGSRTSGVDGSSEGGRINTIQLPAAIMLHAVALLEWLRSRGLSEKPAAEPVRENGIWSIRLRFMLDERRTTPCTS